MGSQTTVLIAEGHQVMRDSLEMVLSRERDLQIVGVAVDGQATVTMAAATRPDVVMLDLGLPRIDGIEVARQIRGMAPATGIVLLSAHDRPEYVKAFLKDDTAGKAFLLKGNLTTTEDLVRTIQDVSVGRTVLDPTMVTRLTASPNLRVGSRLKGLTNRELQVLALMARAHSNRAIADILFIQPRTVEHHISSILAKLSFIGDGDSHGRVHAVLSYLDATGQLPLRQPDTVGAQVTATMDASRPASVSARDMVSPRGIGAYSPAPPIPRRAA